MEARVLDLYRRDKTRLTRQSRWSTSYKPQSWQFLVGHASDIAEAPLVFHVAMPKQRVSTTGKFAPNIFVSYGPTFSVGSHYVPKAQPILKNDWAVAGNELRKLKALKTNWDGYGGQPISKEIMAAATELLKVLNKHTAFRPIVVPMSTGHIQFEWHRGSKVLEFELEDRKTIHYLKWFPTQNTEEESFVPIESESAIRDLLDWFEAETQQSNG